MKSSADSTSYASYLASHNDNPYHLSHIWEFKELATRIAQEQIYEIVPPLVEELCKKVVNECLESNIGNAINYDIHSIATASIKDFNSIFKSEAFTRWLSDAIIEVMKKRIDEIEIPLKM